MPTPKQLAKIKHDWIAKRKQAISSKIGSIQDKIYNSVVPDIISMAKDKKVNQSDLNSIQNQVSSVMDDNFPGVMKETVQASRAVTDLNHMYFSTLMDSTQLEQIKIKTNKIIDRNLGLDENGAPKPGGFVDKAISNDAVQKQFINEVKKALMQNGDVQLLKQRIRDFIQGAPGQNGILQRYYNTFAKDILNNIDRSNSNIYANELNLNQGYYGGGLIKTSRCFCLQNNGKIFTRDQMDNWSNQLGDSCGPVWNEKRDGSYDPVINLGGLGCLHTIDWITSELAKARADQNKIAAQRNSNFKAKNGL